MSEIRQTDKNDLDRIYDIYKLGDLFAAVYRDSDYRFGELHFREAMDDGDFPDHLVDPPESMQSGWTRVHEIPMVLHPDKGALLLRPAWVNDEEPEATLHQRIEETHNELTALEWRIRSRLESDRFWQNRPIVMGVGVVVSQPTAAGSRPDHIPEPAIIDREALPRFATHIDALFEHYTMPAAQPVADWGQRLVAELTAPNGPIGGFVGEQNLIEAYDGWGCELDGLVVPAKMRESAASADRNGY